MPHPIKYELGQTVYIENRYSQNKKLSEVKVTNVGRKWVHLSDGSKIERGTRHAEVWNGNTERVFLSNEEYEEMKKLSAAWTEFRKFVERRWDPPEGVEIRDIVHATKLLKLEKIE